MQRPFARFIGVDLGGGRGKTTVVAELRMGAGHTAEVVEVATRADKLRWTDDTLVERLTSRPDGVVAIDAPLTRTSCARCPRPACPGMEECAEPAVEWLRTSGRHLVDAVAADAAVEGIAPKRRGSARRDQVPRVRLSPYAHRATDVVLTYQRGLLPISTLGTANSVVASRGAWLAKRLASAGYELHRNLIEVSPAATLTALCGSLLARGYKRDADPWQTRAAILTRLGDLTFAPQSRMAREDVLSNDHCFDAVIAAYTAFRWARDGWEQPSGPFCEDGWIFAPPE